MNMIRSRVLETIASGPTAIPDPCKLVHLQFRRYAGCPFCSAHIHSFVQRHADIVAAGINEVVVFRSTKASLLRHHPDLPFAVVADPGGELYREFDVRSGLVALLDPRAMLAAVRALVGVLPRIPGIPMSPEAMFGFPADFLIDIDGRILASHYGKHADDQWSVDQLLVFAGR